MKTRYLITNGELGTLDNSIVRYSLHPNGQRALKYWIQELANRTGREAWAYRWPEHGAVIETNRYYPRQPNNR
jgi:hypothetical protein